MQFYPKSERALEKAMGIGFAFRETPETEAVAGRGHGFRVAVPSVKARGAVPHELTGSGGIEGISLPALSHVFLAAIEVHIEPGCVPFQRGQTLIAPQWRQPAARGYRGIRQT